jgi:hypothetical protein
MPPLAKLDPDTAARRAEINERRFRRFFGEGGIVDRYERCGDELVEVGVVARELADIVPGLRPAVVLRRVALTAKRGEFGLRRTPDRDIVVNMIDLSGTGFEPGQYPLRPSVFTVGQLTAAMRARRSVWAAWIAAQGWPAPPWYRHGMTIGMSEPPAALDHQGAQRRPASRPAIRAMLDELYEWANMFYGRRLDKRQTGRQGKQLLRRRNLDASAELIEGIAAEPKYAERRRKRGRPPSSKSAE